jgi:hypothetical protein
VNKEKDNGRILNIKYSARIMGWHDKGEREKEKGKRQTLRRLRFEDGGKRA